MYDLLEGVRVVELASFVMMPAAGSMLADWGADVIKIEPPTTGDPWRTTGMMIGSVEIAGIPVAPQVEIANRGKRSVGLDITVSEGRDILYKLLENADVFTTNLLGPTLVKLGVDLDSVRRVNPRVVYVSGSGNGVKGPEGHRGGFDIASHWSRSGIADRMTVGDAEPPTQPGSVGDLTSGLATAGAIAAALFKRERTGVAPSVEVALYAMGMWTMTQSITASSLGIGGFAYGGREASPNPLTMLYQTKDKRWLCLTLLQGDKWWPDFREHLGIPDDPRFRDNEGRLANRDECVALIEAAFARKTLAQWREDLADLEGVWAPVLSVDEVLEDPQALANNFITEVEVARGESYRGVATPAQFDGQPPGHLRRAPLHCEHTDEVLREIGLDDAEIESLKKREIVRAA